jgi:hypothetical protein
MIHINLYHPILDFDGNALKDNLTGKAMTLGRLLLELSKISYASDSEDTKLRVAELGIRVAKGLRKEGGIDPAKFPISQEDLNFLYQRAVEVCVPIVLYRLKEVIDGVMGSLDEGDTEKRV